MTHECIVNQERLDQENELNVYIT